MEIMQAQEKDVPQIMDLFIKIYGEDYPFKKFYDTMWLTKSIYSDDNLFMVAKEKNRIIGTGSVFLTAGGFSDLIGEFGRLVVDPDYGGKGAGPDPGARLHPRDNRRRQPDGEVGWTGDDPLSARTQRLSTHRTCQVHLSQLRHRRGIWWQV